MELKQEARMADFPNFVGMRSLLGSDKIRSAYSPESYERQKPEAPKIVFPPTFSVPGFSPRLTSRRCDCIIRKNRHETPFLHAFPHLPTQ
jgi:hypothetical protein